MSANEEFQEPELVRSAWKLALAGDGAAVDTILGLEPKCFEGVAPAALWSAFRELLLKGKPRSEAGVRLALAKAGELGPEGQYWESFRELLTESHGHQPLNTLREGVWDAYVRRSMIELCENKLADLRDPENGGAEVAGSIIEEVEKVTTTEAAASGWTEIEERWNTVGQIKDEKTTQGAWTGFDPLDHVYPIPCGGMTVIAARSNVGKSNLALTIMDATIKHGRKVIWVNMDMPKDIMRSKMIGCVAGVDVNAVLDGTVQPEQRHLVAAAIATLKESVEFLHFPAFTSWEKVRASIAQAIRRSDAKCVILDQFSQLGREKKYGDSDHSRWSYISTSIKNLAQSNQIAFINLVQVNRAGALDEPGLHELAATGSLEQDAAGAILLWPSTMTGQSDPKDLQFGSKPMPSEKFKNNDDVKLRLAKSQIGQVGMMLNLKRRGDIGRFIHHVRFT